MNEKLKKFLKSIEPWHVMLTLVFAIVGGLTLASSWIRGIATDAVTDEKFLGTLAAKVRPTCIFDSRGVIEVDLGTAAYIEEIKVVPAPASYGFEIFLKAKMHLAYAPLISGVDVNLFSETTARQAPHGWYYKMTPNSTVSAIISEGGVPTNQVFRFKLEILH